MACVDDDSSGWQVSPSQAVLFADEIAAVRAVLGAGLPDARVVAALTSCGGNAQRAINALLDDTAAALAHDGGPKKGRIDVAALKPIKEKRDVRGAAAPAPVLPPVKAKAEAFDEVVASQDSDGSSAKAAKVKSEPTDWSPKVLPLVAHPVKKEERRDGDAPKKGAAAAAANVSGGGISLVPRPKKRPREEEAVTIDLTATHPVPYLNPRPIRALPPPEVVDVEMYDPPPLRAIAPAPVRDLRMVVAPPEAEFGDFPVERDWFLVSKSYVTGLSTNRGRRMMDAGEVVHFAFPSYGRSYGGLKVSAKKAAALVEIVRFSTKRAGEIGKLSPNWANCLVPLVNSSKVKIQGKIVFSTMELRLMQEILLYVSFYIHISVFTEGELTSWNTGSPASVDYAANPLHQLFNLLNLRPSNKDDFSLDELSTRKLKRILRGNHNSGDGSIPVLGQTFPEQGTDEQAISEAALNKIIGIAEGYDLEFTI